MDKQAPSMLKPALIGGGAFGVAAGIPIVNWLNCLCCALVIGGGFLAAYLQSKTCAEANVPFAAGNGALTGLFAAAFYAIAASVVGGVVAIITGQSFDQALQQAESMGAEIPPEAMEILEGLSAGGPMLFLLIGFGFNLLAGAIFSTAGGLIGGVAFKVEPRAAAPATATPPAAPPIDPES